jgi:peptidoglycan/LPS O-acetylase OafA/YrhL
LRSAKSSTLDALRSEAPPERQPRRSKELDGLRGLAALTVVFLHFYLLFPTTRWTPLWRFSPLFVFIAGGEAVVLFFVLSGFALDRMYAKSQIAGYLAFVLRRVVRIYGPYLVALALAVTGDYFLSHGYRGHFSPWFNRTWIRPFDWSDVWRHAAFLGVYNGVIFDTSFWSLVHEMRISLIFPLLFVWTHGRKARLQLAFAFSLVLAGAVASATITKGTDLGESILFSGLFVAGICLSEQRIYTVSWYRSLSLSRQAALLACTLLLYFYGRLTAHLFPPSFGVLLYLPVGIGASGIILIASASRRAARFLTSRPIAWLGDISYSLYLIHGTVLFSLVNLLNLRKPAIWPFFLYLPLSLTAAAIFYSLIERPLVLQSRRFTRLHRPVAPQSVI